MAGHHRPTGDGLSLHVGAAADRRAKFMRKCSLMSKAWQNDPNALLSEASIKTRASLESVPLVHSSDRCTPHRVL